MKIILKPTLLLLVLLASGCAKEQAVTIDNKSKTEFYVMSEKEAKHITAEKIYNMHSSGEIEHLDTNGSYTRISTGEYLKRFLVDSSYVFYFITEADVEKPTKGKSRPEYKTLTIPAEDHEHLSAVEIHIKDSLNIPVFESAIKYKKGI
ncbi:hypothetical protein AMR72_11105 [Flavobacterium psychrophilum]|nr:hypothetical protein AMR72_11105 [Flavobacterium psychrophilum]AOE53012.1 hypothetical protein ALW18_11095 [Flavobacterium psychrophilum]